jgi:hypothetical protein
MIMAQNLYFARNQIKYGRLSHTESIYRKLIDELMTELEDKEKNGKHVCDHAQLAVSTLLLALLLQRKNQITETRSTVLSFCRIINSAQGGASHGKWTRGGMCLFGKSSSGLCLV